MGRARTSFALALALSTTLAACGTAVRAVRKTSLGVVAPPPSDMSRARTAWAYFTPAVPAEDARGAGFVTPASLGDDIAATYAARRLGLIDRAGFDRRIADLLVFLRGAQLSRGVLPGRYMDAHNGKLVDPPGRAADPGWSAVEVGQLLVWLRVLAAGEPRHAQAITAIVKRWHLYSAVDADGILLRSLPGLDPLADAGTGFAAIAALGLRAWGVEAQLPMAPSNEFAVDVAGVSIGLPLGPQIEPLLTTPAALIEMIFGSISPDGTRLTWQRDQAALLAEAQQRRDAAGVLSARSNYRRGAAPYSVENAVLASGFPWSVAGDGAVRPDLALVSVSAAFGLRILMPDGGYGDHVVSILSGMETPGGWTEGQYEIDSRREPQLTAATNAMVLAAVLHRQAGTFYSSRAVPKPACETGPRP